MLVKQRGWLRFLAIPFLLITLTTGVLISTPVAADCPSGQTPVTDASGNQTCQTTSGQDNGRTNARSCSIEKIGWFLCPLMESGAKAIDWTFNLLADRFLAIQPEIFNNSSPTKDVWEQARNVANVMFVIAFVILIYSQITGGVMSNYGIKRMLPRLIIGAVAVNASYYICQGMVDLSNILGYNIFDIFKQFSANLPQILGQDYNQGVNTQTSSTFSDIIVIILASGAVAIAFVGFGGAIISVTLITLLTVLTILMLRKAFIILLIVASPLAFVAYLLPNTEKWFKKWLDAFTELLMVFPIVALLLGSGTLASGIVLRAGVAQQQNNTACQAGQKVDPNTGNICQEGTFTTVSGQAPWSLGLVAVGIQIAPLLFLWVFLKGAIAAMGAIGKAIQSGVERGAGGGVGLGKDIKKRYENTDFAKEREQQKHHRDMQARAGTYSGSMLHPIRSVQSSANKRIVGRGGRLGAYKSLTAKALEAEEGKKTSALIGGDGDFAAVAAIAGDASDADFKQAAIDEYYSNLSAEDQEKRYQQEWVDSGRLDKFQRLKKGGYMHSAGTYAALAELGASSGKASGRALVAAAEHASHASNDASVKSEILQAAKSTTKKTGRSDSHAAVLGAIDGNYSHGHWNADGADAQATMASKYFNTALANADGISKDMFSGPNGAANTEFFKQRLLSDEVDNGTVLGKARFEGNLRAYTSLSSEAQAKIDGPMLEAANKWREAGTPAFTTIQEARNYYLKNH